MNLKTAILSALATYVQAVALPGSLTCQTQSQPNPISQQYPNDPTGTLNGTVIVLPIPYSVARAAIPLQYPILIKQYQQWLPNLGQDMYPAMLNTLLDHDIKQANLGTNIPDFSRAVFQFPFVDRLNDGYTAMTYTSHILISNNLVAIGGSAAYGYSVTPAIFDPPCDAYKSLANGSTTFSATPDVGSPGVTQTMTTLASGQQSPITLDFVKNITNQPQFGNTPVFCDNFIRLYNTSYSQPPFAPTAVKGTVTIAAPYAPQSSTWTEVYGYNLDTPFIEKNFVTCASLQGYSG